MVTLAPERTRLQVNFLQEISRRPPLAVLPAGKTLLRSSRPHTTEAVLLLHSHIHAPERTRTSNPLRELTSKASAYTNSATGALIVIPETSGIQFFLYHIPQIRKMCYTIYVGLVDNFLKLSVCFLLFQNFTSKNGR